MSDILSHVKSLVREYDRSISRLKSPKQVRHVELRVGLWFELTIDEAQRNHAGRSLEPLIILELADKIVYDFTEYFKWQVE